MDTKKEGILDFGTKMMFGESMYIPKREDRERFWKDMEKFNEDENRRHQDALCRAAGALAI